MSVIVFDEVELLDVAAPVDVLSRAGRRWNFRPFKIELVAPQAGIVGTRQQVRLEATASLSTAAAAEIVIVPGGYGARRLLEDDALMSDVTRLLAGAELIAAIGWGVPVVARAGCAKGACVTAPEEARESVLLHAPDVVFDPSAGPVASGRLLTARASGAALELGLALVARTLGPKLRAMVMADLGLESSAERIEIRYQNET